MSSSYHESELSTQTRDIHRALASLQEELEAVDWYHQRIDVADSDELKKILEHNRDEEIEHAAMILEWLRRQMNPFEVHLKEYLFTEKAISEIEDED